MAEFCDHGNEYLESMNVYRLLTSLATISKLRKTLSDGIDLTNSVLIPYRQDQWIPLSETIQRCLNVGFFVWAEIERREKQP
jgi:hypothetical protein